MVLNAVDLILLIDLHCFCHIQSVSWPACLCSPPPTATAPNLQTVSPLYLPSLITQGHTVHGPTLATRSPHLSEPGKFLWCALPRIILFSCLACVLCYAEFAVVNPHLTAQSCSTSAHLRSELSVPSQNHFSPLYFNCFLTNDPLHNLCPVWMDGVVLLCLGAFSYLHSLCYPRFRCLSRCICFRGMPFSVDIALLFALGLRRILIQEPCCIWCVGRLK
jgi:hypothetical protein